jgi:hypothetical protein
LFLTISVAPSGLISFYTSFPRLKPWAIFGSLAGLQNV